MFPTAVSFALIAMFAWAIWALLATRATQWLAPEVAVVLSYLASIPVAIGYVLYAQSDLSMPAAGVGYAIGAGVFVALGTIAFYLDTSYRITINLLKEMPQRTGKRGRSEADISAPSTLCKAFNRISMSVCRVLLRQSAQLHNLSEHTAIDSTFYDRSPANQLPRSQAESHENCR